MDPGPPKSTDILMCKHTHIYGGQQYSWLLNQFLSIILLSYFTFNFLHTLWPHSEHTHKYHSDSSHSHSITSKPNIAMHFYLHHRCGITQNIQYETHLNYKLTVRVHCRLCSVEFLVFPDIEQMEDSLATTLVDINILQVSRVFVSWEKSLNPLITYSA